MFNEWNKQLTRRVGFYKYMPVFFVLGAAIELFMIKVRVGNETFCKYGQIITNYKRKRNQIFL